MTPRLVSVLIAVCGLGSIGCDEASAPGADDSDPSVPATAPSDTSEALSAPSDPEPTAIQDDASPPPPAADSQHAAADPQPDNAQPRVPDPPAEAPIERRVTKRPLMVYFEPKLGTDFRGKLPSGAVFELYERVEGTGSGECRSPGWGRIGEAAFLCLRSTEPTEDEATVLPPRLVDGLAPFFYARRRPKRGDAEQPAAPRYRSRRAMTSGAEPEGFLDREHDYAFVGRRRYRGGAVLKTRNRRVVREADVKRMKPSDFAGRDTLDRPIPAGTTMTWSITWPYATVRAEPHPDAEVAGRLEYHREALTHDEPRTHRGDAWYPITEPIDGWVLAEEIRRWVPMEPPADLPDDALWLDVELEQQVLAVRRGATVEFVTLISSGNYKHGTPAGLFRLESKWAYADMRSRAGDDDTYHVEGVPWVQYFRGRYALHGTFWHNRFGRRTSHGCINLSAHDARWVYERTWPVPKPGWIVINEHAREPGTLLRIRKGTVAPPDRRRPAPGN